jgi:tRNA (guanine37-N1)-methyltransferase
MMGANTYYMKGGSAMRFDVFSLLPEVMQTYLQAGVIGKAHESGLIHVHLHNIRDYTVDRHRTTDDEPYGGGGGMVMMAEPLFKAVEDVLGKARQEMPIILLTPQGRSFTQVIAHELVQHPRLVLLCGRYEGVDERVRVHLATDEISIGEYVLTGGELPALVVIDSVARLLPGVLGDVDAPQKDSFSEGLLEHPHYTRPASFRGWDVPEILLSGDHARIDAWRREQSLRRTFRRRPDLLSRVELSEKEKRLIEQLGEDEANSSPGSSI